MNKKTKICSTCSEEKDLTLFVKNSNQCKKCKSLYLKKYQRANKEIIKANKKKNYEINKEIILKDRKEYYEQNKETVILNVRNYRKENSDIINENKKEYYESNKANIKYKNNIYDRERRRSDTLYRLRKNLSKSIYRALIAVEGSKSGQSVMKYLPYSIKELKEHLESQFEPWMTWANHGSYISDKYNDSDPTTWTWHIDHIIPQSKLLYSSMEEENFQKSWALSNLRPLKSIDNIKKGNKIL